MDTLQIICYVIAMLLLVAAAFGYPRSDPSDPARLLFNPVWLAAAVLVFAVFIIPELAA